MATLRSYVERMPPAHQHRYVSPQYWVGWANSLLERMSGMGVLQPARVSAPVPVVNGSWVDIPPRARDVLEIRNAEIAWWKYAFEKLDGKLHITNATFKAGDEVLVIHMVAYVPVDDLDGDLGLGDYDNLIESWLRWKAEELESVGSPDCEYWRSRVDAELRQLRGEAFNHINAASGRELAGFM
jgi:hypothetical protein